MKNNSRRKTKNKAKYRSIIIVIFKCLIVLIFIFVVYMFWYNDQTSKKEAQVNINKLVKSEVSINLEIINEIGNEVIDWKKDAKLESIHIFFRNYEEIVEQKGIMVMKYMSDNFFLVPKLFSPFERQLIKEIYLDMSTNSLIRTCSYSGINISSNVLLNDDIIYSYNHTLINDIIGKDLKSYIKKIDNPSIMICTYKEKWVMIIYNGAKEIKRIDLQKENLE